MQKKLTNRQKEILSYLAFYIRERGFPPSIREIGAKFDIRSLRGVTVHLDALAKKGWIQRGHTPRSIRLLSPMAEQEARGQTRVPLIGTIRAGAPALATENVEDYLSIPSAILRRSAGRAFALRVQGDSMIEDHIMPGDIAIVSEQATADSGDIVAALIGEEATVKRLKVADNRARLVPANPLYKPIDVDGNECRILGKVIGLIRSY